MLVGVFGPNQALSVHVVPVYSTRRCFSFPVECSTCICSSRRCFFPALSATRPCFVIPHQSLLRTRGSLPLPLLLLLLLVVLLFLLQLMNCQGLELVADFCNNPRRLKVSLKEFALAINTLDTPTVNLLFGKLLTTVRRRAGAVGIGKETHNRKTRKQFYFRLF